MEEQPGSFRAASERSTMWRFPALSKAMPPEPLIEGNNRAGNLRAAPMDRMDVLKTPSLLRRSCSGSVDQLRRRSRYRRQCPLQLVGEAEVIYDQAAGFFL